MNSLRFADDIILFADSEEQLAEILNKLIDDEVIEEVEEYRYLRRSILNTRKQDEAKDPQKDNNRVDEIWSIQNFPERQENTNMLEKKDNGHSHGISSAMTYS